MAATEAWTRAVLRLPGEAAAQELVQPRQPAVPPLAIGQQLGDGPLPARTVGYGCRPPRWPPLDYSLQLVLELLVAPPHLRKLRLDLAAGGRQSGQQQRP